MDNSRQSPKTRQEIYDFMIGLWTDEQLKINQRYSTMKDKSRQINDTPPVPLEPIANTLWQLLNLLDQAFNRFLEEQERNVSGLVIILDSYKFGDGDSNEEWRQARTKFKGDISINLDFEEKIQSNIFDVIYKLRQMVILFGAKTDNAQSR